MIRSYVKAAQTLQEMLFRPADKDDSLAANPVDVGMKCRMGCTDLNK